MTIIPVRVAGHQRGRAHSPHYSRGHQPASSGVPQQERGPDIHDADRAEVVGLTGDAARLVLDAAVGPGNRRAEVWVRTENDPADQAKHCQRQRPQQLSFGDPCGYSEREGEQAQQRKAQPRL